MKNLLQLREFFKAKDKSNAAFPLKMGDLFPHDQILEQPCVICFISLTCADCIELLPQIQHFINKTKIDFSLYCVASELEVMEIKHYFSFDFPIKAITEEDLKYIYHVPATPFAYYLKNGNLISSFNIVHNDNELEQLIILPSL